MQFSDLNWPRVHLAENLSINNMKKKFASNLLSYGSIEQDCLSKNVKNLSFAGV